MVVLPLDTFSPRQPIDGTGLSTVACRRHAWLIQGKRFFLGGEGTTRRERVTVHRPQFGVGVT